MTLRSDDTGRSVGQGGAWDSGECGTGGRVGGAMTL